MNNDTSLPQDDRLLDLLTSYALHEIDIHERTELSNLLEQEDGVTADEFETAAAALHLAMMEPEALPAHIHERVAGSAMELFVERPNEPTAEPTKLTPPTDGGVPVERWQFHPREAIAWLAAIAAGLFIAFGRPEVSTQGNGDDPPVQVAKKTVEEKRDDLVAEDGTVERDWGTTEVPDATATDVTGDIVWNTDLQEGYMKFSRLAQNDPTEFQYQLWIFDKNQKDPIDGGVFDITDENAIVPIAAKLKVVDAYQFAVTIEKPGGVPKSDKERIAVLAAL